MDRRAFARRVAGTAIAAVSVAREAAARGTSREQGSQIPFKLSVMLWTVFKDLPFEQRLERVAEAGYRAVELVDEFKTWSAQDYQKANARKRSLGISFDATAGIRNGLADPQQRDAFLSELRSLIPTAAKLECSAIIVLSGNRVPGLSRATQHESCIEGLKRASELAAKQNITLLLENIDPEENPRYYLTSVSEGLEIVRKINHPRVKFLYDFYHEQISGGNLIAKLDKNIDLIGCVHVADVPGRHAPGTGEINFKNIFRKLAELNYDRYAAMEFIPTADTVAELKGARALVSEALSSEA